MKNSFIVPLLTLILGGGFAAAILNLVRAKNESKKAPVDRDAVIVNSAESAVVIMQKVLDSTSKRLGEKEVELEELQTKMIQLREEITTLKVRCGKLEEMLNSLDKSDLL